MNAEPIWADFSEIDSEQKIAAFLAAHKIKPTEANIEWVRAQRDCEPAGIVSPRPDRLT